MESSRCISQVPNTADPHRSFSISVTAFVPKRVARTPHQHVHQLVHRASPAHLLHNDKAPSLLASMPLARYVRIASS